MGGGIHQPHGGRDKLKTELKAIKKNPLIGRREITFEIKEPSTPSRAAVRRDIAVLTKTDLDQIWVMTTRRRLSKSSRLTSLRGIGYLSSRLNRLKLKCLRNNDD